MSEQVNRLSLVSFAGMTLNKCDLSSVIPASAILRIWTLTGCPTVQGNSSLVQVKEPYGNLDMVILIGFHPATRSVQSNTCQ